MSNRKSTVRKNPKSRTVELVHSSYQPTKAEKEEEFNLKVPGETPLDRMGKLARAVLRPVKTPVDQKAQEPSLMLAFRDFCI